MPGRLVLTPLLLALIACAKESGAGPNAAGSAPPRAAANGGEKIAVPGALPVRSAGEGALPKLGDPGATEAKAGADTSFKVEVIAPPAGKAGTAAVARVRATPGPGYHMNHEYPASLKLTTVDGISADRPSQDLSQVAKLTDDELIFEVKLTAARAGTFQVPAEFKFAVCTDTSCDPKKQTVAIAVTAQ